MLQIAGDDPGTSDPSVLWRAALKSVTGAALRRDILNLLCLQWGVWLAKSRLNAVRDFQVGFEHILTSYFHHFILFRIIESSL